MSREVDLGARKGSIVLDVDRLIETRLLIQARSGAGKTRTIKKLLEATHGKVQHIVFDIEGEYTPLRAKFPYIIAGKGGDIPVNPRSAELLAIKILELEMSIIIDLYELKQHERIEFVAKFLTAMTNAKKELWHPVMVVIDEAHIFAPEKSHSSAALLPVIDLATRGRKRGFCCVLATQRLSKLHKDAAAECINKMIGGTSMDIDLRRASDEIGFTSKADFAKIKSLKPGEFFIMGPAFSGPYADTNVAGQIGAIQTDHAEVGTRGGSTRKGIPIPAPTAQVKAALAKLVDLPKEVEEEAKDRESLRLRVRELEKQLRSKGPQGPTGQDLRDAHDKGFAAGWQDACGGMAGLLGSLEHDLSKELGALQETVKSKVRATLGALKKDPDSLKAAWAADGRTLVLTKADALGKSRTRSVPAPVFLAKRRGSTEGMNDDPHQARLRHGDTGVKLGTCELKILELLTAWPERAFSKAQIGSITGYASGSGNFNNAISRLATSGYLERRGGDVQLGGGREHDARDLLESRGFGAESFTLDHWMTKLGKASREIFQIVNKQRETSFSKETLGEITGYAPNSGNFSNAVSKLNTLGLVERRAGVIRFNPKILELGFV